MTALKKIALVVFGLLLTILIVNYGLLFWMNKQLPKIIASKNATAYAITYNDIHINLFSKNIKASRLTISPKTKTQDSLKKRGLYAKIESIEINDYKIWDILFNNRIKAKSIIITVPEVVLYKKTQYAVNNSASFGSQIVKPFDQIIIVSNIILKKGNVKIIRTKTNKPILSVSNLNLNINGIVITDEVLKNKIPFFYKKYTLLTDSIYYRVNDSYHLTARSIQKSNSNLIVKKIKLRPEYSRRKFIEKLNQEKDLFTLKSDSIIIDKINWGFKNEKIFLHINSIIVDQLAANIYRNKIPADDLSKKTLYSTLLRDLQFPLKVDTVSIRNSSIVYEEEISFEKGPGILTFDNFNLKATQIQSGYQQKKLNDVAIDITCKFMNNSPLKLNWTFNVLDKKDQFTIYGIVSNLNTLDLAPFTKPYISATTEGIFDELKFTIKGNHFSSYADASLKYHGLKVTLYRKGAPEKKNKIKSALANLIIKDDSNGKIINTSATVERIPEKSFYNFLWLNIATILKQILI